MGQIKHRALIDTHEKGIKELRDFLYSQKRNRISDHFFFVVLIDRGLDVKLDTLRCFLLCMRPQVSDKTVEKIYKFCVEKYNFVPSKTLKELLKNTCWFSNI